jgi:hypothetical protein
MTSSKWIGFFVMVFVLGLYMHITANGGSWTSPGMQENPANTLTNLMGGNVASETLPLVGNIPFLSPAIGWMQSIYNVIVWRFNFLQPYPMVAWIVSAFSIIGVVTLIVLLFNAIRGNVTWGATWMPVYHKPNYPEYKDGRWYWK